MTVKNEPTIPPWVEPFRLIERVVVPLATKLLAALLASAMLTPPSKKLLAAVITLTAVEAVVITNV